MMNRYKKLMQRIANNERILIDGATGTEVERRGVPQLDHAWNGGGALSHPDIVRQVHQDYIEQGAQIIISNTFGNNRHAMADAGLEEQFEIFNRRGVDLAVEARTKMHAMDVLVAGGISNWSWTGNHPKSDELFDSVLLQAQTMSDAGADLLMLEMMVDIERMLVTLDAAQGSGLPVWAGLSCKPDEEGVMCLLKGEKLTDCLAALEDKNIAVINIMHSEVEYIDACLDVLQEHWSGVTGVYAHTGKIIDTKWQFDDTISPNDYALAAKGWLERGVQVIGGCCGIRAEHIGAVARHI